MKLLIQRVSQAAVHVDGSVAGEIAQGLLVLLGLEQGDDIDIGLRMIDKLLAYRVFSDHQGKMNCSVTDVAGGILFVSQFTLAVDTNKGLRPGFSSAMAPQPAEQLYEEILAQLKQRHPVVEAGIFGANMQVSLINDGPVTFLLQS